MTVRAILLVATASVTLASPASADTLRGALADAYQTNPTLTGAREVADALAGYALPILDARITQRVSYPGTAAAGTTVLESEPDGDAAAEVRALAAEIKQKLI